MSVLKDILIYRGFHRIISTNTSSRWFGRFANSRIYPPLLRILIKLYVGIFKIDLDDYLFSYDDVTTFNAFFTRKLKDGTRNWEEGICSPVDGTLLSYGSIENGMIFQVKGMEFSLEELTGNSEIKRGSFVNLYLSPADYHRVHAPFDMKVQRITHMPGKLFSVSVKNASSIRDLYIKNERVVITGNSQFGRFYFVFVGALNVGSIGIKEIPEFRTNLSDTKRSINESSYVVKKGEELGWFEMGSTVLVIMKSDDLLNIDKRLIGQKIKLGNKIN